MNRMAATRSVTAVGAAIALLAGCGGSQPPVGGPGATSQNPGSAVTGIRAQRASSSSTYQVLYRFNQSANGRAPKGALIDVNGTLYGTTSAGGESGNGTVYSIGASGVEKTLYSFRGGSRDGSEPMAPLIDVNGTLYGTTWQGGASYKSRQCGSSKGNAGCGTVFAMTLSGKERVVYSFSGVDGSNPASGLIDVNGTLYGTTRNGGTGWGNVYSISTTGAEKVLYNFTYGSGGTAPLGNLIAVKGVLYGTTSLGGESENGTVYSLTTAGVETTLHWFAGYPGDGANPHAGLVDVHGILYGTTAGGGHVKSGVQCFCGTVYTITTSGKERVVYSFGSSSGDGADPTAELIDVNGTLYGTTLNGGDKDGHGCVNDLRGGCGAVYSITKSGIETVLHSFAGGTDGAFPGEALVDVNGTLYGTTEFAHDRAHGPYHRQRVPHPGGPGTVFALTP